MPAVKKIKGRYEVKATLGEGGMGVVYRAYDPPPMDRDVALKTLLEFPDRMSLQLFYKECEVLKSMSHPNIVEIFDMGEFEDAGQKKPFFVMPLLRGTTLDELIRNTSHRLTVERVVEIMAQTCRGLQAAHEAGLVHRDLKPSNIWVMEDDAVKIIDFGVAHTVDSRTRSSGFQKGTLLYMAPEQIQFKPVSPQSDIFSLAVVCYEALTRRQPFRGNSEEEVVNAILKHIPPPASEINPAVSQTVSRVVHKAMAKQPWNRFDSAREFGETLQKALRNQPIDLFDPARIQPRIQRAAKALESGDYQFAGEIVGELEAEGNLDPQLSLLRTQIDQVVRQKTIAQLLESARARYEEDEDPLALQKIQDILQLDPNNMAALGLKSKIENRRSERQIEKWLRLAQQHVDNHSYSHAREALENVTQLKPNESRALRLLSDIEGEEQEYLRLRQQKAQVYQSALNAWKNGEVSQALTEMGIVLDLDRRAPDTSSPETSSTYQNFYNQVSSEHDAINTGYAEANRALSDGDYAKALKLCQEFLTKYPNQAVFQALKFDVEEQQRQQLSAFIAEVNRRLEAERDLDAKVNLLREALAAHPDETHFQRSLRLLTDKRDLVNSILARARSHEQQGQINEALGDLETLRTIYGQYPGLQFEVERLQKRREQQARDEAKARWLEQIDRQLGTGNYVRSLELLQKAEAEFPNDAELVELQKLARESFERATRAEQLLTRGQELCEQGNLEEGAAAFREARQLDERNPGIKAALRDALVEQARATLEKDWRAAEKLTEQALALDANHALAKSIRAQAMDRKRDEAVSEYASKARRLQAAGNLQAAATEVAQGLRDYPSEARLAVIRDTLNKELGQAQQKQARSRDLESARGLAHEAETIADTDKLQSIYERTQGFVAKYPEEPELQTIAREVERIVKARGVRKPTPKPKVPTPKPKAPQTVRPAGPSLLEKLRPLLVSPVLPWATGAVCLLLVVFVAWLFWPARSKTPPTALAVPVEIHTTPTGARIRINAEERGTSNLRLDLPAGDYQLEASLPGYETTKTKFAVKEGSPPSLDLTLQPLVESLRIATPDLDRGQVWLDNSQIGSMENGSFTLPSVAAGQHVLRIAVPQQSGQDATIQFQSTPDSIAVSPPLQAHQLQVVVVTTGKGTAQVMSTLGGLPVTVDDQPSGQLGSDGLQITGLNSGTHELVLGAGKDLRKVSFEMGSAPALDTIVFSDRDVGSMLIQVAEDDVDVFLDNKPYQRKTQHGQVRIPNLKTTSHTVRVHKDGFQDPGEQKADVLKGQEARLRFTLEPLPKMASLQMERMLPGTQVSLDDKPIGTVGTDGTLSDDNIPPGEHALGFSLTGYPTKRIERKFVEGLAVHFSGADVEMKRAQAVLEVIVAANTPVTISQGSRTIHSFDGPRKVSLDEGTYIIAARGANGLLTPQTVKVAAGESKSVDLRSVVTSMERWGHPDAWTEQGGWHIHRGGGFVLYDSPPGPGNYVFTLKLKRGHNPFSSGPRLRWVVGYLDDKNYTLMQLDSKFLYRTAVVNGNKQDLPKLSHKIPGDAAFITISLDVLPGSLIHRYRLSSGDWQMLDIWDPANAPSLQNKPRSFTDGKFGFYLPGDDTIEISNFFFYPKR